MLWESVDPRRALTERFGFADAASAVGWMGDALSQAWEVVVHGTDRLVISDHNLLAWITADGGQLIAKMSVVPSRFQRLADTASLMLWLHERGIPVAAPIPTRDGRLRVESAGVSLGVCPVIGGDLLDVNDPRSVSETGHMLAILHESLATYPNSIDGRNLTGREQLVHNDFRAANILHDGASITAVLDFEEVAFRPKVDDLAKAMVLLGTRYRDWRPTNQTVRELFLAAYCERAPLSSAERKELQRAVAAILAHSGWEQEVQKTGAPCLQRRTGAACGGPGLPGVATDQST